MTTEKQLIFWELNEINFDFVNFYIGKGKLPNWKKMIKEHGLFTTFADEDYDNLQPWIQWPTLRTGLDFDQHGIYRLGDIEGSGLKQHWEILEDRGYSVAAMSPINAANNTKNSTFWVPDPWVDTKVSGNGFIRRFSKALKQAVNDNSEEKLTLFSMAVIFEGLITRTQFSSWRIYLSCVIGVFKKQHWSKAIFLDRLLADIFINLWKSGKPDFSVLWLNGGAHIQHHYMCSSESYKGAVENPEWYILKKKDPLLEILEIYDSMLEEMLSLKNARLMIAVGLRQVPYEELSICWRLKNHDKFLTKLGVKFKKINPRMSRDFLIEFESEKDLIKAEKTLLKVKSNKGDLIFSEVHNNAGKLFVSLTFSGEITNDFSITIDEKKYANFNQDVVFVAIKNGHHDGLGYYLDSSREPDDLREDIPLKKIFSYIIDHFPFK